MIRKFSSGRVAGYSPSSHSTARTRTFRASLERLEERRMLTSNAYINEIYFNPPAGGDAVYEYLELRGTPGMSLANTYLIFVENEDNAGHTGHAGEIDNIFNLSSQSIGSNGFLTIRQNNGTGNQYTVAPGTTNLVNSVGSGFGSVTSTVGASDDNDEGEIENGGFTAMLIDTGGVNNPTLGFDLDAGNNGLDLPTGRTGWTILDSIGLHAEGGEAANGRLYAPINFGVGATSNLPGGAGYVNVSFEVEYIARWGNSTGSAPADWVVSNLTDNPLSGFTGNGDFRQSGSPHGIGAPGQVVESSQAVPYGQNLTSTLGAPNFSGVPSTVASRNVFYNNSFYDDASNDPGLTNDTAIATDKTAYLPNSTTSGYGNYTTYAKGINGLLIDFNAGGNHAAITASDFTFKMSAQGLLGQSNDPTDGSWNTPVPAPTSVTYRAAGTAVSPLLGYAGNVLPDDRIEIIWADGSIVDRWLEVIVKANANTGLAAQDVFFFGNMPGDTNDEAGSDFKNIDANDQFNTKTAAADPNNTGLFFTYSLSVAIANTWDHDRNGDVNASDQFIAKSFSLAPYTSLNMINLAPGGPFAPSGGGGGAAVASALAGSGESSSGSSGSWVANRLADESSGDSSAVSYFAQLGEADSPLVTSHEDESLDAISFDDDLLDDLSGGLKVA